MCLIAWFWQPDVADTLLLVGNRDEFYARPAQPLQWWDGNRMLAGRDLQAGGTWMGVGPGGRVAALTNYRDPAQMRADAPSRGSLVSDFLQSSLSSKDYLFAVQERAAHFNPFNLLVYDGKDLIGFESRHAKAVPIQRGLGAVSNADFNTPWPKLTRLKNDLRALEKAGTGTIGEEGIWTALANRQVAEDATLPHTGLPTQQERSLSSIFIASPVYGTRASTLIRLQGGTGVMEERRFDAAGFTGKTRVKW